MTHRNYTQGSQRWRRLPWLCVAWSSICLGALGAFLPLLPTTPFLLVAAWAAPKGSPALSRWIHNHPHFGPTITAWQRERAVSFRAKVFALVLLISSWSLLFFTGTSAVVLAILGLLFVCVGLFLLSRPTPAVGGHLHHE